MQQTSGTSGSFFTSFLIISSLRVSKTEPPGLRPPRDGSPNRSLSGSDVASARKECEIESLTQILTEKKWQVQGFNVKITSWNLRKSSWSVGRCCRSDRRSRRADWRARRATSCQPNPHHHTTHSPALQPGKHKRAQGRACNYYATETLHGASNYAYWKRSDYIF